MIKGEIPMRKRTLYGVAAFLSAVCLWHGCVSGAKAAETEQKKPIRVGWFEVDGYQYQDDNGNRSGYGYDYYQEIAKYTGWTYEYVPGTWQECLGRLNTGEIDILSFVQYSQERDAYLDLTPSQIGQTYAVLTAKEENNSIVENDYSTMNKKNVAVLEGAAQMRQLQDFMKENRFSCNIVFYPSWEAIREAFDSGKADMVLGNNLRMMWENERVIAKFAPQRFYLAVQEGNTDLLSQLENALQRIKTDDEYFSNRLMEKYFSSNAGKSLALSQGESIYARTLKKLQFAVMADQKPMAFRKDGELQGINVDIARLIAERLGLVCEIKEAETELELKDLLIRGEVDAVLSFNYDYSFAEQQGVYITMPYLTYQYNRLQNKKTVGRDEDQIRVAAVKNSRIIQEYLMKQYKEEQITYYASEEECIGAVNDGRQDVTFANTYIAEYYLQDYRFNNIASSLTSYKHQVCLATNKSYDTVLNSILGKAVSTLDSTEINDIIMKNSHYGEKTSGLIRFFYEYPLQASLIILLLASVFVTLFGIIIANKNRSNRQLQKILYIDPVTGESNYLKFLQEAEKIIKGDRQKEYALVYIDIQNFKYINDTYGHAHGDRILTLINGFITGILQPGEITARAGADRFVTMLYYKDKESLTRKMEKWAVELDHLLRTLNRNQVLILKSGIYVFGEQKADIDTAIDSAIYAQKTLGRTSESSVVYYNVEMQLQLKQEKELEQDMYAALDERQFVVYFQPKVEILTKKIMGAEALVRWKHPTKGFLTPGSFIPFFEKNGFVKMIDIYVFEEVCRYLRQIIDAGLEAVPISCNYSRRQLGDLQSMDRYLELLQKYQIDPAYLDIELTEEGSISDMEQVKEQAEAIKRAGFQLSIDDFGSGSSSVQLFYRLPIDVLKLDKSIIPNEDMKEVERELIKSIIHIAGENGISVIWEGIETKEQESYVKDLGCQLVQGYLYARPMPFEDYFDLLKKDQPFS